MDSRQLPDWKTGVPDRACIALCYSDKRERRDGTFIARWDGHAWQASIGWFDHGVTHWIIADEESDAISKEECPSG